MTVLEYGVLGVLRSFGVGVEIGRRVGEGLGFFRRSIRVRVDATVGHAVDVVATCFLSVHAGVVGVAGEGVGGFILNNAMIVKISTLFF